MSTLEDVARKAGVSLATASRVLNGSTRRVGAPLREKVERAAAELGYEANVAAQALARGSSNVVGLVVHTLDDPYFATMAEGAIRAAERHGLTVMVGTTRRDPEREVELVATLRAQRSRAIVLAGSRTTDAGATRRLRAELDRYRASGGRVACVGQDLLGAVTVAPGNREGAAALARALADLGHRHFAVLTGPADLITGVDRTEGFTRALDELALPAPRLVPGGFDRDGGHTAALDLLNAGTDDLTCVFAVNDVMAVGALAAFRERGVAVPDELSVAGFDDIATLRDLVPALTTVRLPLTWMGERVLELALADDAATEHVPAEIILRESTRKL
ncbi:LacI family DNA-binding transcriptional regulator [Spirillospora sp. CA-294931]|uniref:LacI family DNA-binding transcriptional regulator n=1 Tax=Spirillospora sp. CA-294931 TaxID=3240042 RepID=UPI003D9081E7